MIDDWDDAYANGAHIDSAEEYPHIWASAAAEFRTAMQTEGRAQLDIAYGPGERQRLDLFLPRGTVNGLALFVHGGYWRAFDKSSWSHLAAGAVDGGWSMAIPSYDLAPQVSIAEITAQVARAIQKSAALIEGPIRLSGHSAGGHLVTRMICEDTPLPQRLQQRIERVISISGLHDLRPLLKTAINDDLRMDMIAAETESAALKKPIEGVELICWVGADERPEFIRQCDLLANIWTGCGLEARAVHEPGRHHFDVIAGLADSQSALLQALLAYASE